MENGPWIDISSDTGVLPDGTKPLTNVDVVLWHSEWQQLNFTESAQNSSL